MEILPSDMVFVLAQRSDYLSLKRLAATTRRIHRELSLLWRNNSFHTQRIERELGYTLCEDEVFDWVARDKTPIMWPKVSDVAWYYLTNAKPLKRERIFNTMKQAICCCNPELALYLFKLNPLTQFEAMLRDSVALVRGMHSILERNTGAELHYREFDRRSSRKLLLHITEPGVRCLVNLAANLNEKDGAILLSVITSSKLDLFNYLIENGAKQPRRESNRVLCLEHASSNGMIEVLKAFLQQSNELHLSKAAICAARGGHLDLLKYVVENGAPLRCCDDGALKMAAKNGHYEVVRYLVEEGLSVTAEGSCAFRLAAQNGHLKIVKYLLGCGANVCDGDFYAFMWAEVRCLKEMLVFLVGYLLENKMDVSREFDMVRCRKGCRQWKGCSRNYDELIRKYYALL